MPIFYKWDGVGLSLVRSSRLITQGAKDIEAFSIHDQQYIAVANYRDDQGVHHLDSEIYLYSLDTQQWVLFLFIWLPPVNIWSGGAPLGFRDLICTVSIHWDFNWFVVTPSPPGKYLTILDGFSYTVVVT